MRQPPEATEPFIPPSPVSSAKDENVPPRLPGVPEPTQFNVPCYDPTIFRYVPNNPGVAWYPPMTPWGPHPAYYGAPIFPQPPPRPPPPPPPTLHLHSQLSYNLHDTNSPDLVWDIIHPPDYARLCDRRYFKRWVLPDFDLPAFEPSAEKVWVLSDHPVLAHWISRWGPMAIRSEKVAIKDVLDGIYHYLRTPLTAEDMAHIKSIPGNRDALRFARARRAKESREVEAVVIKQGYKRVDVLGGHRRFQGLRIVIFPDYSWRLHLGLLPGPVTRLF